MGSGASTELKNHYDAIQATPMEDLQKEMQSWPAKSRLRLVNALEERYYVGWHTPEGGRPHVEGERFYSLGDAEALFRKMDGGPFATALMGPRGEELRYYGSRLVVDEIKQWCHDHRSKEPYYVGWHTCDGGGHSEGKRFDRFEDAEALFREMDGGSVAVALMDPRGEVRRYYGMDLFEPPIKQWCRDQIDQDQVRPGASQADAVEANDSCQVKIFTNEAKSWRAAEFMSRVQWLQSEVITTPFRGLRVSCKWRDHGWGDGFEGWIQVHLFQGDLELISLRPFGSIGSYRRVTGDTGFQNAVIHLDMDTPIVKLARPGDHFKVFVGVGGSNCELHVKEFSIVGEMVKTGFSLQAAHRVTLTASPDHQTHLELLSATFPFQGKIDRTEHRAISAHQLTKVVNFVRQYGRCWKDLTPPKFSATSGKPLTPDIFNLYHMNEWVILPATKKDDCALVELMSSTPQKPNWFVSHWWGELVVDFLRCVESHCNVRGLPSDTTYWVCAYANRQHSLASEISNDPNNTSFFRAMTSAQGVLLVLDIDATAFTRIWCCYEESVVSILESAVDSSNYFDIASATEDNVTILTDGLAHIDRAGPNHPASFWKGRRESSFPLPVIEKGLEVDVSKGQASMDADRIHILNAIAGQPLDQAPVSEHPNYDKVNRYLRASFAIPCWRAILELGKLKQYRLPEIVQQCPFRDTLEIDLVGSSSKQPAEGLAAVVFGLKALRNLTLILSNTELSSEDLKALAEAIGNKALESLSLQLARCKVSILDLELAFKLNKLQILHLALSGEGSLAGLPILGSWLSRCGPLQDMTLELTGLVLTDQVKTDMPVLASGIRGLVELQKCSLFLDFLEGNTEAVVGDITASLRTLPRLKTLNLKVYHDKRVHDGYQHIFGSDGSRYSPQMEDMTMVLARNHTACTEGFDGLVALTKLKRFALSIRDNGILTNVDPLMAGLTCQGGGREHLQELDLSLKDCRPISPRLCSSLLKGLLNLRVLSLRHFSTDFPTFCLHLVALRQLERLKFHVEDHNDIKAVEPLLEAVGKLSTLQDLDIALLWGNCSGCRCEDFSLAALARSLTNGLKGLRKLRVEVTPAVHHESIGGTNALVKSLASLPELSSISLDFSHCYAQQCQSGNGMADATALVESLRPRNLNHFYVSYMNCFALPVPLINEFNCKDSFELVVEKTAKDQYYVCWHTSEGGTPRVEGQRLDSFEEAEALFQTMDGGTFATAMVGPHGETLRYYGTKSLKEEIIEWCREQIKQDLAR